MPLPRSATLVTTKIAAEFRGNGDGLVRRRILIGIFDEMNEDFRSANQVHANARQAFGNPHVNRAASEREFRLLEGGGDDVVNRVRRKMKLHFAGVQSSHFSGFADQAIQAIALFVDDGEEFVSLIRAQALDSTADS